MLWTIVDLTMIEGILLNWRRHWISWAQNLIFVAKIEKMLQLKDFCGWRPIWVRCLFNLVFWVLLCTQAFGFILFFSFLVSLSLILDSSFMSEAEPSSVASWAASTASLLVTEDLLNNLSFSLNFLLLLTCSPPASSSLNPRYSSYPLLMFP